MMGEAINNEAIYLADIHSINVIDARLILESCYKHYVEKDKAFLKCTNVIQDAKELGLTILESYRMQLTIDFTL